MVFGVVVLVFLVVLAVLAVLAVQAVQAVQMHENWPMRVLAMAIAMEQLVLQ